MIVFNRKHDMKMNTKVYTPINYIRRMHIFVSK